MKGWMLAALPWALSALGVALCVRRVRRRSAEAGARDETARLCTGVCLGAAAGALAGWSLSLSIVMGALLCVGSGFGFSRGAFWERLKDERREKGHEESGA